MGEGLQRTGGWWRQAGAGSAELTGEEVGQADTEPGEQR